MDFKKHYHDSIISLRKSFSGEVLKTYGMDLLFYLSMVAGLFIWNFLLLIKAQDIQSLNFNALVELDLSGTQFIHDQLLGFFFIIIISLVLMYLYYLLVFSYVKGHIWFRLQKKQFTGFWTFFWLSAIINTPFFVLFLIMIIAYKAQGGLAFISLLPFILHFSSMCTLAFTKYGKIWKSLKKGLTYGFTKLLKLALPYSILVAVFYALNKGFAFSRLQGSVFYSLIFILVILLWASWARYLFFIVMKNEIK